MTSRSLIIAQNRSLKTNGRALARFPRTIDNFETTPDGVYESGESISDYYSVSTDVFSRTNSEVVEGSYALQSQNPMQNRFIISEPVDGLLDYPDFGDTVGFIIKGPHSDGLMPAFVYNGSIAIETCYTVEIRVTHSDMRFRRMDGIDNYTEIGHIDVNLDLDTWYWGEVDIPPENGDSHEWRLYNFNESNLTRGDQIATTTMTDANYTDQDGIGAARHSTSGTGTFLD